MKKFFKVLFISFLMIVFTGISCTKEKPLCETNNFAHVTVHNSTGMYLWVDATSYGDNYNLEVRLAPGGSHVYTVIPGIVTVWAASDAARQLDSWNYDEISVARCDEYSWTWTKKKSIGRDERLFVDTKEFGKSKMK
jgi:hypothetical protein